MQEGNICRLTNLPQGFAIMLKRGGTRSCTCTHHSHPQNQFPPDSYWFWSFLIEAVQHKLLVGYELVTFYFQFQIRNRHLEDVLCISHTKVQVCGRWGLTRTKNRGCNRSFSSYCASSSQNYNQVSFSFETGGEKSEAHIYRMTTVWKMRTDKDQKKKGCNRSFSLPCASSSQKYNLMSFYLKPVPDEKSEAHKYKITTCSCSHNQMFHVNPTLILEIARLWALEA